MRGCHDEPAKISAMINLAERQRIITFEEKGELLAA
jgi:hypothetical protein